MVDQLLFYALLLLVLLWLGVILYEWWARTRVATRPTTRKLATPLPKHSRDPKPFPGLTHKPSCAACEQVPAPAEPIPLPPLPLPSSPGRPRQVNASGGAGVSARLCPLVSHRWVQGVSEGRADALRALGPTAPLLGHRPSAQTPLAAAALAAVCAGDQDDSPAPASSGECACGVRHPGRGQTGPGSPGLAAQHGFR
jgi:hypothetical protein